MQGLEQVAPLEIAEHASALPQCVRRLAHVTPDAHAAICVCERALAADERRLPDETRASKPADELGRSVDPDHQVVELLPLLSSRLLVLDMLRRIIPATRDLVERTANQIAPD